METINWQLVESKGFGHRNDMKVDVKVELVDAAEIRLHF